ncbi:MAG: CDP-alcohol phosphatidyltransferase family protein [Polymorphobacter sp.]|uniref:CDP-alcohol phosphatidyltransferase family protein n=1 Tax=Polymorphobacter sp. TaxID=1909290 RepID=UPI003A880033
MLRIGVLLAPEAPRPQLVVGGLSLVERQARMLRRMGCERLFLVGASLSDAAVQGIETVSFPSLAEALAAGGLVIIPAPGLIIDERAVATLLAGSGAGGGILVSDESAVSVERLDSATLAAGVMALPAAMVASVARDIGDWDFHSTLIRLAAADPTVARIPVAATPLYAPERRRSVPLLWCNPQDAAQAADASAQVIAAAQKGTLDWPARFIHPLIEDALVRLLAPTRITPNQVTLFTAFIAVAAGYALATGALWWGLGLALLCGPLDGVDGKLARVRIEYSRWGDLEHVLDKILEYGWYLCAAWWFSRTLGSALPWALAALIILPALAEAAQGEFYRRLTGVQLDDAGPFERGFRLVAGRRNTFLWTWLAMALVGLWFEGFALLAAYSVLTTAVAQWRFYVRLSAFARAGDARVAANYAATSYDFLAKPSLPTDKP